MFVSSFKKISENGNPDAHGLTRNARLFKVLCSCVYGLHALTFCILFTRLYPLCDIGVSSNWKWCYSVAVVGGCHQSAIIGQCSLQNQIRFVSVSTREISQYRCNIRTITNANSFANGNRVGC